jgi:hypothetical protein
VRSHSIGRARAHADQRSPRPVRTAMTRPKSAASSSARRGKSAQRQHRASAGKTTRSKDCDRVARSHIRSDFRDGRADHVSSGTHASACDRFALPAFFQTGGGIDPGAGRVAACRACAAVDGARSPPPDGSGQFPNGPAHEQFVAVLASSIARCRRISDPPSRACASGSCDHSAI